MEPVRLLHPLGVRFVVMEKFFNNAGPIIPEDHYYLPVMARLVDDNLFQLIRAKRYFILHAPRQTGKTSALLGLQRELHARGEVDCVYINVEVAKAYREQVEPAMRAIMQDVTSAIEYQLGDEPLAKEIASQPPSLKAAFNTLSTRRTKPVVVFIDEIDSLIGDTLIAVLSQIRAGYSARPKHFPQSIILCGVRDVRDYRIHSSRTQEIVTGGSCFNIKARSLTLKNFTEAEVRELLLQHTAATGQVFEEEALALAWHYTRGQPWLVNALADACCFMKQGVRDRSQPITGEVMASAKDRLIVGRETHLDQLTDKLQEPRVRRVMAPIVAGADFSGEATPADYEYVSDLGLIRSTPDGFVVANAIYQEIIPRVLTYIAEEGFKVRVRQAWYVKDDGTLDTEKLLQSFAEFFRENSESWVERFQYREAGPQLLLQAFLQRVVNGGGRIDREYGLGRLRTDLLVRWPTTPEGFYGPVQRVVFELKMVHKGLEHTIEQGLRQTARYMQRTGLSDSLGYLVIFDRREGRTWEEKLFVRDEVGSNGERIQVWGM